MLLLISLRTLRVKPSIDRIGGHIGLQRMKSRNWCWKQSFVPCFSTLLVCVDLSFRLHPRYRSLGLPGATNVVCGKCVHDSSIHSGSRMTLLEFVVQPFTQLLEPVLDCYGIFGSSTPIGRKEILKDWIILMSSMPEKIIRNVFTILVAKHSSP